MSLDCTDYREIFLNDRPMMDTRAPIEFTKGAFPGVLNLPLMTDQERQRVGTCYKQQGQQAAIVLGHQLVSGAIKEQRIQAWADFARAHPDGLLYCFRGGLRSQIVQQWLKDEAGIAYPRVGGGYKAMRTFLLDTTEQALQQCDFVLLGGMTGTGKTQVLGQLDNALDLEGHANHRGSSFGRRATGQPSNIDFENCLAVDLLKKRERGVQSFVLEDENRMIGSCALPLPLYQSMQGLPMVWLEDSLANRVQRILDDYVVNLCAEFVAVHGEQGFALFAERLLESLNKIHKRLGGERHQRLFLLMEAALAEQARSGDVERHRAWIKGLLGEYYDPMYAFQRESKGARIEFSGEHGAVLDYLRQRSPR
ncbi:tRNA 2-selenouridine synthase [Pseudomonas protegens]|jgi:tRNA 2-selenouridine synthase|uniref:tRNA 2-selenouridine synthase n=1 Tax=Pseudomonas protegens (strain DSM 19095 / LMG 27888 / CFBP 6595 / CHA0) TaxID=1124983 RepID=A0A2C9EKG0_PSEPH|nr:tRNA 2-selenouridine(34) synthase MnmH [Pseudomonas protegens]AGL84115.1 tRNA 2-selenouridine synthase SelU [Pseudomonas protegens CHA0]MBP5113699.1 tRNA 2-selenouridine(34) synthase MnmH [Pseudomonas protegens]MDS9879162.1 tRNA 2-selenouridine(34) synthase MnmH [Pseudomonas protegens]MDT3424097.1 tRNA 2-selenouridine synthase [Pseudomonas protegens]QTU24431.1 tRNA 2-selenouridine(34) synthase MnmH [Pseudomonas protegens]